MEDKYAELNAADMAVISAAEKTLNQGRKDALALVAYTTKK